MDWSQYLEDEYTEGAEWPLAQFNPSLAITRLVSFAEQSPSGYDTQALYIFTINYVLGVGCLGVPYGFARAGVAFGSFLVVGVTVLAYATVSWVAETVGRAERLAAMPCEQGSKCWICLKAHSPDDVNTPLCVSVGEGKVEEKMKLNSSHNYGTPNGASNVSPASSAKAPKFRTESVDSVTNWASEKSYEVTELCTKFLGWRHKVLYQVSLLALMYVGLLAYSQVFANSISAAVECESCSRVLLSFIFGVIVVPLSCSDLEEQVTVQAMMAVARFLAIFVMVGGSLYALMFDKIDSQTPHSSPPFLAPSATDEDDKSLMSYSFAFSGFGVMFSTALFSQLFQHSVPGLIRPLPEYQKRKVPQIFMKALATTMTLYLVLGISAACYFGSNTSSSVNLNFTNFSYGINLQEASPWQVTLVRVLSNVVVLFPAADTLSVFPLIANTLGNNLSTSSPGMTKSIRKILKGRGWAGEELKAHTTKVNMILWRLIASVPPILASVYAKDLAFSLQLAGLAGLYVAFICPALLQRASSNAIARNFGETEISTIYSGWQSKREVEIVVLVFSLFAAIVVMTQIRSEWVAMMREEDNDE
mmetsp:Transcript_5270/g.10528  ORF Transcript_5270/g.10528 Transcript_5270/m.10528 type:complete len:589 (+) Transcript_5270:222-1988(+)